MKIKSKFRRNANLTKIGPFLNSKLSFSSNKIHFIFQVCKQKIWQKDLNDYHKKSLKNLIWKDYNGWKWHQNWYWNISVRGSLIFAHIAPIWFHWIMNMMQISYKSWNCKYKSVGSIFKTHVTVVTYYCKLSFLYKVIDSLQR